MILGVDGLRLVTPRSGVARYIENVLRRWAELDHPFQEVRVYTPWPLGGPLPAHTRNVVLGSRAPLGLWQQLDLPRAHGRNGVLFCPSYVAPLLARAPTVLVHHGSYEAYPEAFGWWPRTKAYHLYRLSARSADRIVTVSEHSRRDIARFYGVDGPKVCVIPPGVDTDLFRPISDERVLADFRRETLGEDAPFILFVGKPARRRNVPALFQAYARLRREGRTAHRFLFIGSDLPGGDVARMVQQLGLERDVTLVGHASHETIAMAYNASSLLAYPSSYEGFGLPVLEAMACGTPALALRTSAFPEFAEGAAYLAEGADAETLYRALDRLLHDDALRERLRRVGPERARAYDWRVVARRTMEVVRELVGTADAREAGTG